MTLSSVFLAIGYEQSSKTIIRNPSLIQCAEADSVHVLAFTSQGELLVAESEGSFTLEDWDEIFEVAKKMCCDGTEAADDFTMQEGTLDEGAGGMSLFLKSAIQAKVAADLHWKD